MTAQRMTAACRRPSLLSGIDNQPFCLGQNRERSALRGWWRSQWWAGRSFVVNSFEKKQTEDNGYGRNQQPDAYQLVIYGNNVVRQKIADDKGSEYDFAKINKNLGKRL